MHHMYIFNGNTLYHSPSDEHRLSDYSIGPEAKLNLVIRPVGERTAASGTAAPGGGGSCSSTSSGSSTQGGVWQTISTILARHFSPADAAKVHEQLIKVYKCSIIYFFSSHKLTAVHI